MDPATALARLEALTGLVATHTATEEERDELLAGLATLVLEQIRQEPTP